MPADTLPLSADTAPAGLFVLLREDVRCVFGRDPAARTTWEVLTTYPGVHAIILHRLTHALWRRGWRYTARLLSFIARVASNVDIHPGARIGRRFFIDHGAGVVIGETAEIGNDVTLYHGVTLGGTTWNPGKRHPTLGDHVVVGAGAKILGAITLGARVRVGANSVVVKSVPADCTVVGIPARVVRRNAPILAAPAGLNLDHHLIPDPVGHTLDCMIERIRRLEDEFRELSRGAETHPAVVPATTPDCQAGTGLACDECACQPGDTPPDHRDTPPPSHPEPCRSTPMEDATLEEALAELSTAEDFLDHFGITYDPAVVQVNRLHILQRYHDYLANNPAPQGDDGAVRAHYRRFLELAYRDFTASDAVTEKVFAVFRKTSGTAFVPLDAVRR